MEDRAIPPSPLCHLSRSCEVSRLQCQLLARAYQQVCPEMRRRLPVVKPLASQVKRMSSCRISSTAARAAAGA
jgi:hypothetical protein